VFTAIVKFEIYMKTETSAFSVEWHHHLQENGRRNLSFTKIFLQWAIYNLQKMVSDFDM
jgi:hypothetical protein